MLIATKRFFYMLIHIYGSTLPEATHTTTYIKSETPKTNIFTIHTAISEKNTNFAAE